MEHFYIFLIELGQSFDRVIRYLYYLDQKRQLDGLLMLLEEEGYTDGWQVYEEEYRSLQVRLRESAKSVRWPLRIARFIFRVRIWLFG